MPEEALVTLKLLALVVLAVLAASACGGRPGGSGSAATAPISVGPAGARLLSASGMARLDVPAGALAGPVEVRIVERFDASGRHEIEIEPSGLPFATPARLTFKLPGDAVADRERVVELVDAGGVEMEIEVRDQIGDVAGRRLEAHVEHAGRYRREGLSL